MIWAAFKLSLLVVSVATLLIAIAGTACGYMLAKRHFRGKELLDSLLTLPMVLPPTVTGYYLIMLLGRRGLLGRYLYELTGWTVTFSWEGAALAAFIVAMPLMVKSARAAIESVDPRYEVVSYTFGKGRLETFFRVTLPLASRGLLASLVLSFARALGEFGATLMIAGNIPGRTQTLPLAIYDAVQNQQYALANQMVLLMTTLGFLTLWWVRRMEQPKRVT